jgi:hypothetical protein
MILIEIAADIINLKACAALAGAAGVSAAADLGFGKRASGKLLERCSAYPRRSGGTGGAMATRESNVIMFPQRIDPEHKEDRIAEQFFVKVDGLVMKGLAPGSGGGRGESLGGRCGRRGGCCIFMPFDQTPS